MEFYVVGGWVRDKLLKEKGFDIEPKDRDWMVVGGTPQQMEALGYKLVGHDFPVFINPATGEEYALARTEKKKGHGYHGFEVQFAPDVTLEDDLKRRDLTINAIAMDEQGRLHDPYGGIQDLERKILRHVSPAFAEDPVRLLRVARFAAKYPTFSVAPETMELLRSLVRNKETDFLVGERVGQELMKALSEDKPSVFFKVLQECGYWQRHYPEWHISQKTLDLLDAIKSDNKVKVRFAILFADVPQNRLDAYVNSFKPTKDQIWFVNKYRLLNGKVPSIKDSDEEKAQFLIKTQSLQYPPRFPVLLECLAHELTPKEIEFWKEANEAFGKVDSAAVLAATPDQSKLQQAFLEARTKNLKAVSNKFAKLD